MHQHKNQYVSSLLCFSVYVNVLKRLDKTIKQKQDQIVHQDHEYVQKLRAAEKVILYIYFFRRYNDMVKAIELAKEELHTYESKHESTTARIEQLDAYLHSLREKVCDVLNIDFIHYH